MTHQNDFGKVWTPDMDDQMMERISEGKSFIQTAREMGISHSATAGRFRRLRAALGEQGK